MMNFGYSGIVGLLILTLVVVLLPLLGLILWYFLGPRDGKV